MKSIRVESIRKAYGGVTALGGVTLDVPAGEIFFLLGPSGCGKTTLLRIVAGLEEPDGGKVLLGGEDITRRPPHLRRTAMVFQNYALWPHMTVEQNVAFGMATRGVPRARRTALAREALAVVHMEEYTARKPAQLSGGQQQRVALARAIAADPACLLLDEPLSNLDANLRVEMRGEIRRICKETALTTLYVTHDQKEALSIADRIAVLRDGRLAQVAPPEELYGRPATRFVAGFVGESNFVAAAVEEVAGGAARLRAGEALLESRSFPAGLSRGDAALVSIRPERIALLPLSDGTPGALGGTIRSVVFLGELSQYEVAWGGGAPLKVIETTPPARRRPGDEVACRVAPGDAVVLEDERA